METINLNHNFSDNNGHDFKSVGEEKLGENVIRKCYCGRSFMLCLEVD